MTISMMPGVPPTPNERPASGASAAPTKAANATMAASEQPVSGRARRSDDGERPVPWDRHHAGTIPRAARVRSGVRVTGAPAEP